MDVHPQRLEIARYLLSRGSVATAGLEGAKVAHAPAPSLAKVPVPFPTAAPVPAANQPKAGPDAPLPKADVVVITWTTDEVSALAGVLTPGVSPLIPRAATKARHWVPYAHNFATFADQIRPGAPSHQVQRLGSYYPTRIAGKKVLAMKSELHLNQDGIKLKANGAPAPPGAGKTGLATLPVKDLFKQIIAEAQPSLILTVGTAGGVFPQFGLGDVVVTRAAKFWCKEEFANEPFNHQTYESNWTVPTVHQDAAEALMAGYAGDLDEPPVGVPSPEYGGQGVMFSPTEPTHPQIHYDGQAPLEPFWPILTTDYFEYGTTTNHLDQEGVAVEMGDAALGLAVAELEAAGQPVPDWASVRNMSDPVINGQLPAQEYRLNEQTTWAVGFYTAYGKYTSINSSIAAWAIIAGL